MNERDPHPLSEAEWLQLERQLTGPEPTPEPWSLRRRVAVGVAAAALLWAILVFAPIGVVAVFGGRP